MVNKLLFVGAMEVCKYLVGGELRGEVNAPESWHKSGSYQNG